MPDADTRPGADAGVGPGTVRRAALATALLFAVNGAIFGAIIPRLPEFKNALDMSESQFGVAMAFFPLGALLGGLVTPLLMRGRSDGAVAGTTMVLASVCTVLLPFAPGTWTFALFLGLFGATDAMTDIAMNAHGIRLQVVVRRSIINRFHAVWSGGAVVGAVVSSAALGLGVGLRAQFVAVAAVCAALSVAAYVLRLPAGTGDDPRLRGSRSTRHPREQHTRSRRVRLAPLVHTLAIGLFALSGVLVEDFAQNWAALYLIEVGAAPLALAGAGFIAVQGAQFLGRLSGDGLVDRFGAALVARTGGVCVLLGVGALLTASFTLEGFAFLVIAVGGLAMTGWGVATVIPGAMFASDRTPGLPVGVGLTVLNWMLRIGAMTAPPVVGLISENAGMRWSVAPMIAAGVVILLLAHLIIRGPRTGGTDSSAAHDEGEENDP